MTEELLISGKMVSNKSIFYVLFVLLSLYVFYSCGIDSEKYPATPYIEFRSTEYYYVEDTNGFGMDKVKMEFYLIDGDGDFGLDETHIFEPYIGDSSKNFFPQMYVINEGVFIKDTMAESNYRIPYIEIKGLDNTIKAAVFIDFEYPWRKAYPIPLDSIVYSFYVLDRAFHKSNVAWTDTIVFP